MKTGKGRGVWTGLVAAVNNAPAGLVMIRGAITHASLKLSTRNIQHEDESFFQCPLFEEIPCFKSWHRGIFN